MEDALLCSYQGCGMKSPKKVLLLKLNAFCDMISQSFVTGNRPIKVMGIKAE